MVRPSSTARPTIVVIDDDPMIRELVRLHLKNADYEVLLAEDAVAAGRLIVESSPALILIDVNMPYMNGYEFTSALKKDPATRDIPVVFITADEDVAQRSRQLGAVAYLAKPVRADRLLEVVRQFVPRAP
ncbi:MAG TPA: response regulator [Burkholderiales bacterium]|jgi:putative two-component system response regulator|nr:response regulator [Burkholderiales bacterium]